MQITTFRVATAMVMLVGLVAWHTLAQRASATPEKPGQKEKSATDQNRNEKKPADKPEKKPDLTGVLESVADDNLSITLAIPPKIKGDPSTSITIKLTGNTKITYFGVEIGRASCRERV